MARELSEIYFAIGAGGLSLVVVLWTLIQFVRRVNPMLNEIKTGHLVQKEIVENNTRAITELSQSNQNVANVLGLLESNMLALVTLVDRHDKRAESMEGRIIVIEENVRNNSRSTNKEEHVC